MARTSQKETKEKFTGKELDLERALAGVTYGMGMNGLRTLCKRNEFIMKIILIIATFASITLGCSCGEGNKRDPLCEYYDYIFIGKLIKVEDFEQNTSRPVRRYTFRVEIRIKQVYVDTVQVYQKYNDCTFDFKIGRKYLVTASMYKRYAYNIKILEGNLTTSSCLENYELSSLPEM